jgi:peptidoglycan/LPS O-acetylase OafA/YrhL
LGIAGTRLVRGTPAWDAILYVKLDGRPGRVLRWMGRWALLIYLIHQPLIYGALELIRQAV